MSVRRVGRLVGCASGVTFGAVGVMAGPAAAAGRITAGWPRPGGGSLHTVDGGPLGVMGFAGAAAWTATGSLRWVYAPPQARPCIDSCVDPPIPNERSRPSGPFGPFNRIGRGFVDTNGTVVHAGAGLVLDDGTEISGTTWSVSTTRTTATRNGTTLWTRTDPYSTEFDSGHVFDSDGTTLYRSFLGAHSPVIALNPATGVELWRVDDVTALATFGTGIVVRRSDGRVAGYGSDGTPLFVLPNSQPVGAFLQADADPLHGRVYLTSAGGVEAYSSSTGDLVWASPGAVLSIDTTGTVYLARSSAGSYWLEARALDGTVKWTFDTPTVIGDAVARGDGTVFLTTASLFWRQGLSGGGGLVMRVNPTAPARRVTRDTIGVSRHLVVRIRRHVSMEEYVRAVVNPRDGVTIRFDMRRPTTLVVRAVDLTGTLIPLKWTSLKVPAGRSYVRQQFPAGIWHLQFRRAGSSRIISQHTIRAAKLL